ncbi:MAG: histidine-type phosphatase [Acidobacteriota bacterium]
MRALIITLFCAAIAVAQPAAPNPAPSEELRYAVVLTRHGVRSPTWDLPRLNRYSASPWPDFGVPPGNLTAHGGRLISIMGRYYRDFFTAAGLLGKPACQDAANTYIWADTDQRTLETARLLAETLAPSCQTAIHSVTNGKPDPLFDPLEAGAVKQDQALALAAVSGSIGPDLKAIVDAHRPALDQLNFILRGNATAAVSIFDEPVALTRADDGVAMAGPLRTASTLTENLLLEYTNGMSGNNLGWGRLTAANLQQVMSLHTAYADWMRRTPYLASTRGSNLLSHIVNSLEQAAGGKPIAGALGNPTGRLLVISGHDTNISNVSGMLGLSWLLPSYQQDDVPPGGALLFTLWRSKPSGRYSVRLQVIAQTMDQMHDAMPLSLATPPIIADIFIPGCGTAAKGYPCTWTSFARTARAAMSPVK